MKNRQLLQKKNGGYEILETKLAHNKSYVRYSLQR